jgi:hypothetical protein
VPKPLIQKLHGDTEGCDWAETENHTPQGVLKNSWGSNKQVNTSNKL